jgi:hypothetical protein
VLLCRSYRSLWSLEAAPDSEWCADHVVCEKILIWGEVFGWIAFPVRMPNGQIVRIRGQEEWEAYVCSVSLARVIELNESIEEVLQEMWKQAGDGLLFVGDRVANPCLDMKR